MFEISRTDLIVELDNSLPFIPTFSTKTRQNKRVSLSHKNITKIDGRHRDSPNQSYSINRITLTQLFTIRQSTFSLIVQEASLLARNQ